MAGQRTPRVRLEPYEQAWIEGAERWDQPGTRFQFMSLDWAEARVIRGDIDCDLWRPADRPPIREMLRLRDAYRRGQDDA